MSNNIKIILGVTIGLIVVLLTIIIYLLLGKNSGLYNNDFTQNDLDNSYENNNVSDDTVNSQINNNQRTDAIKNYSNSDKLNLIKNSSRIIFDTKILGLQLKSKEDNPINMRIVDENLAEGFNSPANTFYLFVNPKFSSEYAWISLHIYNMPEGINDFLKKNQTKKIEYTKVLDKVRKILNGESVMSVAGKNKYNGSVLIFPPPNAACSSISRVKLLKNDFMTGIRYTTHCHQDRSVASGVSYIFQGISNDGTKNIYFQYSDIKSSSLEKYYNQNPDDRHSTNNTIIDETFNILDGETDEKFIPSLLLIDNFIESIRYK